MKSIMITIWFVILILAFSGVTQAAEIGLAWDHNDPLPDGYRIYQRCGDETAFDYTIPMWTGTENNTGMFEVEDGLKCFYVVRAYVGEVESADSNEVSFYRPSKPVNVRAMLWAVLKKLLGIE